MGGKTDRAHHTKSDKRKIAQKTSSKVNNLFYTIKSEQRINEISAATGVTLAFQTVMHNHSFNSMACAANFIRRLFNEKKLCQNKNP